MSVDLVHYKVMTESRRLLQGATFDNLPTNNIIVRKHAKVTTEGGLTKLPGILIYPGPSEYDPDDFEGGEGNVYHVNYKVVAISLMDAITNQDRYQGWIETIKTSIAKFADGTWRCTLDAVPSIWDIRIGGSESFEPPDEETTYDSLSMVIAFYSHEASASVLTTSGITNLPYV